MYKIWDMIYFPCTKNNLQVICSTGSKRIQVGADRWNYSCFFSIPFYLFEGSQLKTAGDEGRYSTENKSKGQKPIQYRAKAYYLQETGNKNDQLTTPGFIMSCISIIVQSCRMFIVVKGEYCLKSKKFLQLVRRALSGEHILFHFLCL